MKVFVVLAIILTVGPAVEAQTGAKLPEFEVATIRPTNPNGPYSSGVKIYPGGRVVISALPLRALTA